MCRGMLFGALWFRFHLLEASALLHVQQLSKLYATSADTL